MALASTQPQAGPDVGEVSTRARLACVVADDQRPPSVETAGYATDVPARRFEAVVFDWDATVVPEPRADAARLGRLVEEASAHGLELALVSSAQIDDVDGRLAARPTGAGGLVFALNGGSEMFLVDRTGPRLAYRRTATAAENLALSAAAQLTIERLARRGLEARIVSEPLNRRQIGLISKSESDDQPKVTAADPTPAVEDRFVVAGTAALSEAVEVAYAAATETGLDDPRITSGGTHLEIALTDEADSLRWITWWLWERGIAPDQVLIVDARADVHGAGAEAFAAVLEDQIARRRDGELPIVIDDPEWIVVVEGIDPLHERVHESLLTLADGRLGTRGSVIVEQASGDPAVLMSGVYARGGAETHLLPAPRWNTIALDGAAPDRVRRVLDLHAGLLQQELGYQDGQLGAILFCSLARPATPVLRVRDRTGRLRDVRSLAPPPRLAPEQGEIDGCSWMRVSGRPGSIAAVAEDHLRRADSTRVLDRIAGYEGAVQGVGDETAALDRVRHAGKLGFDHLLSEHRRLWASRWAQADVRIEGDPELQLAVRFALFHLLASTPEQDEAAVGARGLTGGAYRGHVFWDSDVFVLPFLAAARPRAARAMLEYRVRRLPVALGAARAEGRRGARFPWESARSGKDVTPESARDSRGEVVPVLTGPLEEHIVADVAWAAACYIDWTGDEAFAGGPGRELIVQTARWWASRIELDEGGHGHIRRVIGPDEYHECVDDNAYTNVMARWNLRRGASLGTNVVDDVECRRWLELADGIVDGYDRATGIYEQFAGFHRLEPLVISQIAPRRPVSADLLLGHERTAAAQVVKQADVLMLHYLVPDEVAAGSLQPNLDFYEPRTAHGSTLSPGVHAALLARAGQLQKALEMLRLTARIDLDDIGHMTAGGLHLAAMGSAWRTLAFGFAGLRPVGEALAIDPVLAPGWESLELRLRFRASRVTVRVFPGAIEASADPPLTALIPSGERVELNRVPRPIEAAPPTAGGFR